MKKTLLLFISSFFPFVVSGVSAAPNFSHPILAKAYEQVNLKIEQKAGKIFLDENSKKSIEQKKENLAGILASIDEAIKRHDKIRIKEQARLFRGGYKEAMDFIQNIEKIQPAGGIVEITGKSTDVTYYSDSFE